MGSGYFPLRSGLDKDARRLVAMADEIEAIAGKHRDAVREGADQIDNAESDGGAIALLYLAAELLRGQVYVPKPPEAARPTGEL